MSSPLDTHSAINEDQDHDQDPSPSSAPDSTPNNPLLRTTNPLVSSLEQEVLDEYARLLGNVNKVCLPPSQIPTQSHHNPPRYIHPINLPTYDTQPYPLPLPFNTNN